jgi:tetratricopeptide (TPR) repeat protein
LEGHGDAAKAAFLYDLAISNYEECLELESDSSNKVRVLRKLAECWLPHGKASPEKVIECLDAAERQPEIHSLEQAKINLVRGKVLMFTGARKSAEEHFLKAEEALEKEKAMEELGLCLLEHSMNDLSVIKLGDAVERANRAKEIFFRLNNKSEELNALFHLGMAYGHFGDYDRMMGSFEEALGIAKKFGKNQQLFFVHLYRSFFELYHLNQEEEALADAIQALDFAKGMESKYMLSAGHGVLAQCQVHRGRIREAEEEVNEVEKLLESIPKSIKSPQSGGPIFIGAELLAAKGFWSESNGMYAEAEELFKDSVYGDLWRAVATTSYGKSLLRQGQNERAMGELQKAVEMYEKMGNKSQVEKIRALM